MIGSFTSAVSSIPRALNIVRLTVALHLAAVATCLAFSLADHGLLVSYEISRLFLHVSTILLVPSLVAWLVCPAIIFLAFVRHRAIRSMIAEALLCIAQLYVLLPAFV